MGAVRSVRGAVEEHKQTLQEAMVHDKMVRENPIRLHYLICRCSALQQKCLRCWELGLQTILQSSCCHRCWDSGLHAIMQSSDPCTDPFTCR